MRGAERPAKVRWTRPFLLPLKPLDDDAAWQTFIDIADDRHDPDEINEILSLTDNMPLAINLLAHLVEAEDCSAVLCRWNAEKTSLISEGYDRRTNLDLSILLSLSSPRITSEPDSRELLGLLSILPDGLSDVELLQSNLPVMNIHRCRAALIRTTLAYIDEHNRLKVLVPIREYMQKTQPPKDDMIGHLLAYFHALLDLYMEGLSSQTVARISSNYANINNIVLKRLQQNHPDLKNTIYCAVKLNSFSRLTGQGSILLLNQIQGLLPTPCDHRLEVFFINELFNSQKIRPISDPEALMARGLKHLAHFDDTDLQCVCFTQFSFLP